MIKIYNLDGSLLLDLDSLGVITNFEKSVPEVIKRMIEIPGRSGLIDATDALLGYPTYSNREIKIDMLIHNTNAANCEATYETIYAACHGKRCRIDCDFIANYHFVGRIEVEMGENNKRYGELTIMGDCDPYAYNNAITTKNIAAGNINVSSVMPTDIVIKATSLTKLEYEGEQMEFSIGEHKITYPKLYGSKTITITQGTGTIEYQEGKL